ncbi:hypothetical protein [Nocardia arizonensis]|uniref:hypothetical protein n=1 Tax=Nocardia arizonensis TaxID=1141647 RepID=UPI0006D21655|nr:hypothetical protein [Nocardia arizonensis]
MDALEIVVLVIAVVAVVLAIVLVVSRVVLARLEKSGEAKLASEFAPDEVVHRDLTANYFGLASRGGAQIRGNGALVLTDTRLWFARAGADTPVDIPLSSVTAVDLVRSHAGKSIRRDLLRVTYGGDSVAWYVREPNTWLDLIDRRLPKTA